MVEEIILIQATCKTLGKGSGNVLNKDESLKRPTQTLAYPLRESLTNGTFVLALALRSGV